MATRRLKLTKSDQEKLINALHKQKTGIVQSFLKRGWTPKEPMDGSNPLNLAGGIRAAKLLVEFGADVNASFKYLAPLAIHAGAGNKEVIDYLLTVGAESNICIAGNPTQDIPRGTTPLMEAAARGHIEVVKCLLKAGADINGVDEHGHNALFRALYWDKTDTARELIRRGSKLTEDAIGGPVYHGNPELMKLLVKKKANVNCVFRAFEEKGLFINGETPLGCAVSKVGLFDYPVEIIKLLLKAGAKVDQPSVYYGQALPPICIAAGRGLEDIYNLLKRAGSRLTLKEALVGWTLEKACFAGRVNLVKLLLKAGADVNARGTDGKLPIEWARERGHTEIVKLLRKAGAREP